MEYFFNIRYRKSAVIFEPYQIADRTPLGPKSTRHDIFLTLIQNEAFPSDDEINGHIY
jgi:hypothetical protein